MIGINHVTDPSFPLDRWAGGPEEFCPSLWVLFLVGQTKRARVSLGTAHCLPSLSLCVRKSSALLPFCSLSLGGQNLFQLPSVAAGDPRRVS